MDIACVCLISCFSQQDGGGAELGQWVEQYKEEQQRSYEEQSVLALEDRKSALLRAMNSSHTGESITVTTTDADQWS